MQFLPTNRLPEQGFYVLEGEDVHHLRSVMRVKLGARFVLQAEDGTRREAHVTAVDRSTIRLELGAKLPPIPRKPTDLWLACALPKNTRLGTLVRGCTECGVDRFLPLVLQRSVAGKESRAAAERMRKLAREAVKQSGRPGIPNVEEPAGLESLSALETETRIVLAAPNDRVESRPLQKLLRALDSATPWLLVVGPEGGFTHEELEVLAHQGCHFATLGPSILRLETAAIVASGMAANLLWSRERHLVRGGDPHNQPSSANET